MTTGQMIESVMSKLGCESGEYQDATPFNQELDMDKMAEALHEKGFQKHGWEVMYNGATGKRIPAMIFMGPTYYQRLKHMVDDKYHCLSLDHEVLTEDGWKTYDQLSTKVKVACYDRESDKLVYDYPTAIHYYPNHQGRMYKIKNKSIDLFVTDNHRMLVSTSKVSGYELIQAQDLQGKCVRYLQTSRNVNDDYILPDRDVKYMDNLIKFLALVKIHGYHAVQDDEEDDSICYVLLVPRKIGHKTLKLVHSLIESIADGGRVTMSSRAQRLEFDRIRIKSSRLFRYLNYDMLPPWSMQMSQRQSKMLVENMISEGRFKAPYPLFAGQFMQLCLHARVSCTIENDTMCVVDIQGNKPLVNDGNDQEEGFVEYKGGVFCLSVPTEVFMVRRNGKPVWTGNSRATGMVQTLTRQPTEGRSKQGGLRSARPLWVTLCYHL